MLVAVSATQISFELLTTAIPKGVEDTDSVAKTESLAQAVVGEGVRVGVSPGVTGNASVSRIKMISAVAV